MRARAVTLREAPRGDLLALDVIDDGHRLDEERMSSAVEAGASGLPSACGATPRTGTSSSAPARAVARPDGSRFHCPVVGIRLAQPGRLTRTWAPPVGTVRMSSVPPASPTRRRATASPTWPAWTPGRAG